MLTESLHNTRKVELRGKCFFSFDGKEKNTHSYRHLQPLVPKVMSSVNDHTQPDIADKNPALTESLLLMRECIIMTRLEAVKAHRDEAAIEAICQATFDKLAPKRLIRLEPALKTYLEELRQGHGARICHQKADVICRVIYDARRS
jgi:hypothetical protein